MSQGAVKNSDEGRRVCILAAALVDREALPTTVEKKD